MNLNLLIVSRYVRSAIRKSVKKARILIMNLRLKKSHHYIGFIKDLTLIIFLEINETLYILNFRWNLMKNV